MYTLQGERRGGNLQKRMGKYEKVYKNVSKRLLFYTLRRTSSRETAEDIVADAFLALWRNWEKLGKRPENEILAWLYRVTQNKVIDFYRHNAKQKRTSFDETYMEPCHDIEEVIMSEIKKEETETILAAIKQIDPVKREIIELRFGQELKIKEIAKIVKKNEGACKMTIYRSLEEIKKIISAQHNKSDDGKVKRGTTE